MSQRVSWFALLGDKVCSEVYQTSWSTRFANDDIEWHDMRYVKQLDFGPMARIPRPVHDCEVELEAKRACRFAAQANVKNGP